MIKLTLTPSPTCKDSPRNSNSLKFSSCLPGLAILFSDRYFGNKRGVKGAGKSWRNRGKMLDFVFFFFLVTLSFLKMAVSYISNPVNVSSFRIWQMWYS